MKFIMIDGSGAPNSAQYQSAVEALCKIEISGLRRHHEIYLSDPRKTDPDKLKTVIRYPVERGWV